MALEEKNRKSLLKDGELFLVENYLTKQEADEIYKILNDEGKFQSHNLYFYDRKKDEIVKRPSWRKSYWFGDHAQAVQSCGKKILNDENIEIEIPTDFVLPFKWGPKIAELKDRIGKEYDIETNSCLIGKFDSPKNKIGFHSDASSSMGDDPYIISLSFGRPREFKVKKKKEYIKDEKDRENLTIILRHGTLLIMRKNVNKKYLHSVPPDKGCCEKDIRLNATFRLKKYCAEEMKYTPK